VARATRAAKAEAKRAKEADKRRRAAKVGGIL
jgi:hypothetical protein